MDMFDEMVPITREELRRTYKQFPIEPIPQELIDIVSDLEKLVEESAVTLELILIQQGDNNRLGKTIVNDVRDCLSKKPPHKIEENMFLSRGQLEEIWTMCEKNGTEIAVAVGELAHQSFSAWESYQKNSSEKIEQLIDTFLPSDWRRTMFDTVRKMNEQNAIAEIQALKEKGCSVAEKYELLWAHELAKRQTLASVGNMSGVFKVIASTIGGVPRSLLDFVATINNDDGPTQEMRETYGPTQYFLTHFVFVLRAATTMVLTLKKIPSLSLRETTLLGMLEDVLNDGMKKYSDAVGEYVALLKTVLVHSPFFVSSKDIMRNNLRTGKAVDVVVAKDHTIEYELARGETVTWEFTTDKDIKFEVLFFSSPGTCTTSSNNNNDVRVIQPLRLVNSHIGSVKGLFTSNTNDGILRLHFDNSYSWFTNKALHITSMVTPSCQKYLPDMLHVDTTTTLLTQTSSTI